MTQKPGFFKVGDRCRTGAYGWFDNRLYCWRLNWHVPVWKSTIEIDNDFVTAFREGIKEYSFVEVSGLVPLPMFTSVLKSQWFLACHSERANHSPGTLL